MKEEFARRLGRRYRVEGSPETIELELIEVSRLEAPEPRPFAVTFRGPRQPALPQSIHRLTREGEETLEIFIVPIGPDRDGQHLLYEAIFN